MYTSSTLGGTNYCSAHITTNRNRFKIYQDSVYLKNNQNFEIELFNPNSINYLAKIRINGKSISESGILIKPGQRIYLERFIDSNNKFVFETYEIETNQASLEATKDNGIVEITFYPEQSFSTGYITTTGLSSGYITTPSGYHTGFQLTSGSTTTNIASSISTNSANQSQTLSFGGTTVNNVSFLSCSNSSSVETGRVEKGEKSSQNLYNSVGNYSVIPSNSISYRLVPESHKPVEVDKIRKYCTGCGNRMKKETWKFCPSCGEKF